MKNLTLTENMINHGDLLPPADLRIFDGNIPEFNTKLAKMLRPQTTWLFILNCSVRLFVIRGMIKYLNLEGNVIEEIKLYKFDKHFEITFIDVSRNRLTDLSFVSNLSNLESLRVGRNKLKILKLNWFAGLNNLKLLNLKQNLIKTIQCTQTVSTPIEVLNLSNNMLTEFNTVSWQAPNMSFINLSDNRLQSINTIKLNKSFPRLSHIEYHDNPWNCGRLEALKIYMQAQNIIRYDDTIPQCHDASKINTIALNLPEQIDLMEDKLINFKTTVGHLLEDHVASSKISDIKMKFTNMQISLQKIGAGLPKLLKKMNVTRKNVNWFDFFDQLDY